MHIRLQCPSAICLRQTHKKPHFKLKGIFKLRLNSKCQMPPVMIYMKRLRFYIVKGNVVCM